MINAYASHAMDTLGPGDLVDMILRQKPETAPHHAMRPECGFNLLRALAHAGCAYRDIYRLKLTGRWFMDHANLDACLRMTEDEHLPDLARGALKTFLDGIGYMAGEREQYLLTTSCMSDARNYVADGLARIAGQAHRLPVAPPETTDATDAHV